MFVFGRYLWKRLRSDESQRAWQRGSGNVGVGRHDSICSHNIPGYRIPYIMLICQSKWPSKHVHHDHHGRFKLNNHVF